MSIEVGYLIWSTVLLGLYVVAQSTTYRLQYGVIHAAGPRDDDGAPPSVLTARADRALRNFLETYAAFIALAVATELTGRSDALTQWGAIVWFWLRIAYLPLYLIGIRYVRSLVWFVSALALVAMFIGVAF